MRRAYSIALVSFVVALPLLMAPTGGIPSRVRFASIGVNAAVPAGNGNLTASGTVTGATVTSSGAVNGASLVISGSTATVAGAALTTESSGTFTMTLSVGCTTTPSVTASWRKIGTLVSLSYPSISCTTNNTGVQFSGNQFPAAIRPSTNTQTVLQILSCGGTANLASFGVLTNGNAQLTSGITQCAAGTLNFTSNTFSYSVSN